MAINKVVYDGSTLIDLSNDTLSSADQLAQGIVAHDRTGATVTGTIVIPTGNINITQAGQTNVTQYATATVPSVDSDLFIEGYGSYKTVSGNRKWEYYAYAESDGISGWHDSTIPKTRTETYNAIPANTTITPSTSAQTVGGQNYMMEGAVTVSAMPTGTAGTPTATKGTVSNHSVSVTPSVTNTTGYITGSTKTGTAVTVSASELVSGSQTITQNGTVDVTNLASVVVSVEGGGGTGAQVEFLVEAVRSSASSISFIGLKGEPIAFYAMAENGVSTSATATVVAFVYDGQTLHAQTLANQITYDDSSLSYTYNNGTLTITSNGAAIANSVFYLSYAYGGTSGNIDTKDVQVGSGATSITFTGLEDEPIAWSCIFKSNFSTSSGYQRVVYVEYENGSIYGTEMDSGTHSASHWTASYNNGSLTITSNSTSQGGYFHQPGYYQLTAIYGDVEPQEVDVVPLSVTTNGTYTAPSGTAYSPVTVNVSSGGGVNVATTTWSNSNSSETTHTFTGLSGTPKAAFLRCTSSLSRSSSSSNYYVADMRWTGTATAGNSFRRSNGTYANVTSGYTVSASGTSLTVTTTGTSTSNPGSFYNGTYELTYIY